MNTTTNHKIALFFALLFMTIVAAPAVILSVDDRADVTIFFGENDEEEKDNLKLLFDFSFEDIDQQDLTKTSEKSDNYYFKSYPTPHLNLIFPPPEFII